MATTRKALAEVRIPFETNEIVAVKVLNRPGELSKLATALGVAGVNIISVYLLGEGKFALRVDSPQRAREILKRDLL